MNVSVIILLKGMRMIGTRKEDAVKDLMRGGLKEQLDEALGVF